MALTRKFLAALGIESDKIDQVVEAHTETTDALKADRDKYKKEAEKVPELQKKLEETEKRVEEAEKKAEEALKDVEKGNSYKEKYESEHETFEKYKKGIETEKLIAKKKDAYKELLKKAGVSEKRFNAIIKVTSLDDVELDEEGKVKDADKHIEDIKTTWAEFCVKESQAGASTATPPNNAGGGGVTKEDILKIKDRNERQKAISENHELFGY